MSAPAITQEQLNEAIKNNEKLFHTQNFSAYYALALG